MESISNTTVLILLGKVHRFDLLQNMFSHISLPTAVEKEFLAGSEPHHSSVLLFEKYKKNIFVIENPKIEHSFHLGKGESSAISLAIEKKKMFLSDDKRVRKIAQANSLNVMGTPGIILWNVQQKYISPVQAKEIIHQLMQEHYYISTELYAQIMQLLEK